MHSKQPPHQCTQNETQAPFARRGLLAACIGLALGINGPLLAQDEDTEQVERERGVSSTLMEEVTVTARKREEPLQEVPISISAYSGEQLEALKVRDLKGLTVAMPNVALDDVATSRGVANFSIRGLGINSSIPGIDPTVGVFIDGVYLGQNGGVVMDMTDIASIEVLRGPQGILFGRNVTGGAVLINTRRPTEETALTLRASIDGNPNGDGGTNRYVSGALSGSLSDTLQARVSAYLNEDDGWQVNLFDGRNHGKQRTKIIRPSLEWNPIDDISVFLRYEHFESTGDGPSSQSHTNGRGLPPFWVNRGRGTQDFERDSFDFSIDEPGFIDYEFDFVTAQLDWDIPWGNGTITDIFGWRDSLGTTYADIDAQPVWLFHSGSITDGEQWSNELRYNGVFGNANVTMGTYWFKNTINYTEFRDLLGIATGGVAPAQTQNGGGILEINSWAVFGAVDYALTDTWTLNTGLRYTDEDKDAQIATLTRNIDNPCRVYYGTCNYDFIDGDNWSAWSGKIGATWNFAEDKRMYFSWSRGHRSGGYNLRNTAIDVVNLGPGPFDQETVDSFEVGYKSELGGRGTLDAAVFYTDITDMQRELNEADPISGVVQVIKNSADAELWGFEVQGTFALTSTTALLYSVGYVDPEYTEVFLDLNGDGSIDEIDKALKLPRAAEWTYSIGINQDWPLDSGAIISARANYAYRDDSYYTDNNRGWLLSQDILEAGIDYTFPDGRWVLSLYGRNLLDSVNHGGDTQMPDVIGPVPTGGTFSPLIKGRIVGFEVSFNM